MIIIDQLRLLTEKTLKYIELYSPAAVELVLGTIAQESHLGTYIQQVGGGPALGICQIEPRTFYDIVKVYLPNHPRLRYKIEEIANIREWDANSLIYNNVLSICVCRLVYKRVAEELPAEGDIAGMASYWKQWYNTALGAGTVEEFLHNYNTRVA